MPKILFFKCKTKVVTWKFNRKPIYFSNEINWQPSCYYIYSIFNKYFKKKSYDKSNFTESKNKQIELGLKNKNAIKGQF